MSSPIFSLLTLLESSTNNKCAILHLLFLLLFFLLSTCIANCVNCILIFYYIFPIFS